MSCPYCTPEDPSCCGMLVEIPCHTPNTYAWMDDSSIRVEILYETERDRRGYPTGVARGWVPVKYCPMCGREMPW